MATTISEIISLQPLMLPEYLSVETRIVTQSQSESMELKPAESLQHLKDVFVEPPRGGREKSNRAAKVPPQCKMIDTGTLTDNPNPLRHHGQQTDAVPQKELATIGTQCNMDADFDADDVIWFTPPEDGADATSKEQIKNLFEKFVEEKTYRYGNGKLECMFCGEITENCSAMEYHMAAHWKQPRLCVRCGIIPRICGQHECEARRKKRKFSVHKCPHFVCRVTTISSLELYDHINEHLANKCYKCGRCQRAFATTCELRHHQVARHEIRTGIKSQYLYDLQQRYHRLHRLRVFPVYSIQRKHVVVKAFLSQKMKNHWHSRRLCCQVCLKHCSNPLKFAKHTMRCLKIYQSRMQRKLSKPPTINEYE